jgi:hypothetical protein
MVYLNFCFHELVKKMVVINHLLNVYFIFSPEEETFALGLWDPDGFHRAYALGFGRRKASQLRFVLAVLQTLETIHVSQSMADLLETTATAASIPKDL